MAPVCPTAPWEDSWGLFLRQPRPAQPKVKVKPDWHLIIRTHSSSEGASQQTAVNQQSKNRCVRERGEERREDSCTQSISFSHGGEKPISWQCTSLGIPAQQPAVEATKEHSSGVDFPEGPRDFTVGSSPVGGLLPLTNTPVLAGPSQYQDPPCGVLGVQWESRDQAGLLGNDGSEGLLDSMLQVTATSVLPAEVLSSSRVPCLLVSPAPGQGVHLSSGAKIQEQEGKTEIEREC